MELKIRDGWRVARPAGFSGFGMGAPWREAECWEVTVTEIKTASIRRTFRVQGELIAQIHPERWCLDSSTMLPTEAEPVPGVYVGGREFNALGAARDAARDLVTLLGGKMFFQDVRLCKFA